MTKHILITGASGLIGQQLVSLWHQHRVTIISRDPKKGIGWQQLSDVDFDSITHVVHLAGANIAQQRWSKSFKQTIYNSRSDTLTQLSLYLHSAKQLQQVIMCSGSSVYGLFDSDHADWTESKALAQDDRFFCQMARRLEEHAMSLDLPNLTCLRLGVVLSPLGGALPQLVIPYRLKLGIQLNKGTVPLSWIALEDAVRAIDYILEHSLSGPINCVAPDHTHYQDLYQALKTQYRPLLSFRVPQWCSAPLGEMAQATIHTGQHSHPTRLLDAGFSFKYPKMNQAPLR